MGLIKLKQDDSKKELQTIELPLDYIISDPDQPRKYFDPQKLDELAQSIKKFGVIQPISVRKTKDRNYVIIAGERRWRASKLAGLECIPAIVTSKNNEDYSMISLIENIQRENLTYYEEAEAYKALIEQYNLTQDQLSEQVGKRQSTIANKLRLLKHSPEVRRLLAEYGLTERHARALLKIENEQDKFELIEKIAEEQLNVKETEELIDKRIETPSAFYREPDKKAKGKIRMFSADSRIIVNTIKKTVSEMDKLGLNIQSVMTEVGNTLHYTIIIPK